MKASEYQRHDALGLAGLVKSGDVQPQELMQCAVGLAQARSPTLNALCYERYDESIALAATARKRGIFGALPFLLKDTGVASTRFPASLGSRMFEGTEFKADSNLVKRFDEAGLIPFARTTAPEFSMAPTTEATRNGGATKNPWDLTRSPGGSSGGAAVAVAAGIIPMAHGSDGGGSIRIPAACCGVYGLKPSRGLMPFGPVRGEGWGGLAVDGVLSRTVRDTAAALDAVAGIDVGAPYAAPARPESYLARLSLPFDRPLRIAVWSSAWEGIAIDPECAAAVQHACAVMTSLGHDVIDAPLPDLQYNKFLQAHIDVLATNIVASVNGKVRGKPSAEWWHLLEPAIFDGYQYGMTLSAEKYVLAINRFHTIARQLESYIAPYDFILTPTLTKPPAPLGYISTQTDFLSFRQKVGQYTTFLAIINASGQPAASLPLYATESRLPIGVQLIGHFGAEDEVLRLSAQLEKAAPWGHRWPPIAAV
jgi:amidase